MEKRKEKRFKKREMVKVDDKMGMLLDISEDGIKVAVTSLPTKRKVKVLLHLGERYFDLIGEIRWVKKKFSSQASNELGISIHNAPDDYYRVLGGLFPSIYLR